MDLAQGGLPVPLKVSNPAATALGVAAGDPSARRQGGTPFEAASGPSGPFSTQRKRGCCRNTLCGLRACRCAVGRRIARRRWSGLCGREMQRCEPFATNIVLSGSSIRWRRGPGGGVRGRRPSRSNLARRAITPGQSSSVQAEGDDVSSHGRRGFSRMTCRLLAGCGLLSVCARLRFASASIRFAVARDKACWIPRSMRAIRVPDRRASTRRSGSSTGVKSASRPCCRRFARQA